MQVSGLFGLALDWAVGRAIGAYKGAYQFAEKGDPMQAWIFPDEVPCKATSGNFLPSTEWRHGGPLIEAHQVSLHCPQTTDDVWAAWIITNKGEVVQAGDTALIAACRAIVAAHLGEVVSVPAELT
ncbi:hypothetical protein D3C85_1077170 [compost metagenome]